MKKIRIWPIIIALTLIVALTSFYLGNWIAEVNLGVQHEASYIIWRNVNTYYATNGTTGKVQYFGKNAYQIIQKAINSAPDGGTIHLKAATYELDASSETQPYSAIQVNKTIILEGEGNGTILKYAGNWRWALIRVHKCNGATIQNFQINGNKNAGGHGCFGIQVGGIFATSRADHTTIQNVYIHNTNWTAIQLSTYAHYTKILNCIIKDISNAKTADPSIRVEWINNNTLIQGCTIDNAYETGIRTYQSGNSYAYHTKIIGNHIKNSPTSIGFGAITLCGKYETVTANTISNAPQNGIVLHSCESCTVDANTIYNTNTGIRLETTTDNTISANTITHSNYGILMFNSHNNTIADNQCNDNAYDGITFYGQEANNATHNIFHDNHCKRNGEKGIEGYYEDYNIIIGCIAYDNTIADITKTGTHTEVHDCYNGTTYEA